MRRSLNPWSMQMTPTECRQLAVKANATVYALRRGENRRAECTPPMYVAIHYLLCVWTTCSLLLWLHITGASCVSAVCPCACTGLLILQTAGYECWGAASMPARAVPRPEGECGTPCFGDNSLACGGEGRLSMYSTAPGEAGRAPRAQGLQLVRGGGGQARAGLSGLGPF